MPGSGPKYFPCVRCGTRTQPQKRRFINGPAYKEYRDYLQLVSWDDKDVTCINCYMQFHRYKSKKVKEVVEHQRTDSDDDYIPPKKKQQTSASKKSPKIIPLPIASSGKSHSSCCICKERKTKFQTLSVENRHKIFVSTGHLLLSGARCCPQHIDTDGNLYTQSLNYLSNSSTTADTYFNKTEIMALITDIRRIAFENEQLRIDFDSNIALNDTDFQNLTGITKENFEDLVSQVKSIRQTKNRSLANSSRLVTKIRWVVESVNGRLKQWRYFCNIVPNTQISVIGEDIRLVAALCNKYKQPINSGDQEEDQALAAKMKVLASKENELLKRVITDQLDKRISTWKRMDAKDVVRNFPVLSEEDLTNITIGVYQLKLAKSYSCEHLSEDGDYCTMVNDDLEDILRVRIHSRHTSSRSYLLWIEYGPTDVKGWYCQCKAGARIVGACAHISSVLWYLGFARYSDTPQDVKNWPDYLEDASNVPEVIDDSESEASGPEE